MKQPKIFLSIIGLIFLIGLGSTCQAEDYKIDKQNQACYASWYYMLTGDGTMYSINRDNCNRYSTLLLQQNIDKGGQQAWIIENIWLVKKGAWNEKRQAMGSFVPKDSTTAYLAILLEGEGMDLFRGHGLLNRPLFYEVVHNQTAFMRGE